MLAKSAQILQVLWAANAVAGIVLLALLAVRKNYRAYPVFTYYNLANLVAGGLVYVIYRRAGLSSAALWHLGWGMQGAVVCARAFAVAELCKRLLARYRGIWAMAWRILLGTAALVLLYSSLAVKYRWDLVVSRADRSLELAIAVVVVVMLLFAHYYDVRIRLTDRLMALGFCLYSCFSVLNNTILERYLRDYVSLWNIFGMIAYLLTLFIWTWALRKPQPEVIPDERLLPVGVYQYVAPNVNGRLRSLNEQLSQFLKSEANRH